MLKRDVKLQLTNSIELSHLPCALRFAIDRMLITGRSKPDYDRRMDHVLTSNALWTQPDANITRLSYAVFTVHKRYRRRPMAIARRAHHAKIWPTATGLTKGVVPC